MIVRRWLNDPRLWCCAADDWGYEGDYCLAVVDDFGNLQPVAYIVLQSRASREADNAAVAAFMQRVMREAQADKAVKW